MDRGGEGKICVWVGRAGGSLSSGRAIEINLRPALSNILLSGPQVNFTVMIPMRSSNEMKK